MTKESAATNGFVYLASSHHSFAAMGARAAAALPKSKPLVAASYAAIAGEPKARKQIANFTSSAFGGIDVEEFALPGEKNADAERARDLIARADLIFISGGDPVVGARILVESGADAWLREARARGASFLGVSAGSMMLCSHWASWPDDPPKSAKFDGGELVACTGVVGDLVVDCHAEEDHWAELKLVAQMMHHARKKARFRGISTQGALVVHPDDSLESVNGPAFVVES